MALLYHGTDAEFDGFSDAAPGTREGSANNSALGIWFFADRRHAENFGARTLEADVELGRSWRLPLSEFVRLDREAETLDMDAAGSALAFWRAKRAELAGLGYDSVAIVERNGETCIHVVLRASSITAVRDLPRGPSCGM
jgi:hypothetical protein